jgi:hypothetical protein
MPKSRSIPYWTTSVFSSVVTDLVLIYESITFSANDERGISYERTTTACWLLSYITTDVQSASLPRNKAPVWGLRLHFYCQTFASLLMWGALSYERTVLSFKIPPGPRQRSLFQVRVPWVSWPYFTVSDSILLFRRFLRLAGLRWRYLNSPPHGMTSVRLHARLL